VQANGPGDDCEINADALTRVESLPNFDRVNAAPKRNQTREIEIDSWWQSSCRDYRTEHVPKYRSKNLICRIKGQQSAVVVIGAHYDKVQSGHGVADNWSGVVLLDELMKHFQAATPPTYTLEFAAFAAEEPGMKGSKSYLADQSIPIIAMINLDTLGLQSMIITGESDRALACQTATIARSLKIPASIQSSSKITGDWEPFVKAGIPAVGLHSVTKHTIKRIHHRRDRAGNVDLRLLEDAYQIALNLISLVSGGQLPLGRLSDDRLP
jgi:Iap family predicted aminopeptidase